MYYTFEYLLPVGQFRGHLHFSYGLIKTFMLVPLGTEKNTSLLKTNMAHKSSTSAVVRRKQCFKLEILRSNKETCFKKFQMTLKFLLRKILKKCKI